MQSTPNIRQEQTTDPKVFAFRITGQVTSEDAQKMGETMNAAFDEYEKVSMLLIFETYQGSASAATFNWESLKSRFRSLSKVDKYAVVGAPSGAESLLQGMGMVIPVDVKTFDPGQIDDAWAFVGAKPA